METDHFIAALDILTQGAQLLTNEDQKKYFEDTIQYLNNAKAIANNEEKTTLLDDATVKYANQLCFILFRENTITDELTSAIRALITPEESSKKANAFNEARQARIDELNKQHEAIVEEQKDLDIFFGVISGKSVEEAQALMSQHEADIQSQMNK